MRSNRSNITALEAQRTRRKLGFTQSQLAHRMGCSASLISKIECQRRIPKKWYSNALLVVKMEEMSHCYGKSFNLNIGYWWLLAKLTRDRLKMNENELAAYLECRVSKIRMFESGGTSIPGWYRDALLWAEKDMP